MKQEVRFVFLQKARRGSVGTLFGVRDRGGKRSMLARRRGQQIEFNRPSDRSQSRADGRVASPKVKFMFSSFLRKQRRENQSGNGCFWETEEEIEKGSVVRITEGRSAKTCQMESAVLKKRHIDDAGIRKDIMQSSHSVLRRTWGGAEPSFKDELWKIKGRRYRYCCADTKCLW